MSLILEKKKLLFELLDDFKNHKFKFRLSFNTTIFDSSTSSLGLYLRYEPLHEKEFNNFISKDDFSFFHLPCSKNDFLKKYKAFMGSINTGLNNIYGYLLTFFYPNKIIEISQYSEFVNRYVRELVDQFDVPYLVKNLEYPTGLVAQVFVIDRLYLKNVKYKQYLSTKYIDSRTGKFASKNCPDEFKVIKCKKGDYVLDKEGKRIFLDGSFSTSLRHFSFAKDMKTKKNLFSEFIYTLKQKYINALQRVTVGKGARKGCRFKKTKTDLKYHRFVRRRIAALNYAKQTIEYMLNYFLQLEEDKDKIYEKFIEGKDDKILHTDAYNLLLGLSLKMKKRFKKQSFHDNLGILRKLSCYNMRVDILDSNIQILLEEFSNELFSIYDKIPNLAEYEI